MTGADGLAVHGVTVDFGGDRALSDVSVAVPTGQVLAVLGPSGSGKSTLLRTVAGLQAADAGTVRWDGEDVTGVPVHRRGFALMFQDGQLFAHRSVGDNVAYALPRSARRARRRGRGADGRVGELLELVGLPGYADRRPATLSGGEQQRVALARALAAEPRLLLLDEPLSSLDAALRTRLAGDLRRILAEAGATAVAVTHDHGEAFALADRVALLADGVLVQQGTPHEVWRHPATREVARFLGYDRVLDGAQAAALRAAGGADAAGDPRPLAVRPGVVQILDARAPGTGTPEGNGVRAGHVVGVRPGPERTLVDLEVPPWGVLTAVATAATTGPTTGGAAAPPAEGDRCLVAVDLAYASPVGGESRTTRRGPVTKP